VGLAAAVVVVGTCGWVPGCKRASVPACQASEATAGWWAVGTIPLTGTAHCAALHTVGVQVCHPEKGVCTVVDTAVDT